MDHQGSVDAQGAAPLSGLGAPDENIDAAQANESMLISPAQLEALIGVRVKAEIERIQSTAREDLSASVVPRLVSASDPGPYGRDSSKVHAMSESSVEEAEVYHGLGPVVDESPNLTESSARDMDFDAAVDGLTELIVPSAQASSSDPDLAGDVVDLITKDWGLLYHADEKFGPPVSEPIAQLVNSIIRARPDEEQLKVAMADVLVPENTKKLTVPLLNKEFEGIFSYKHGVYMERQMCRQVGMACKALGPLIRLLDGWNRDRSKAVRKEDVKGVSDSVRLIISMINLQNYARKQNVLSCVRDPNLKSLCTWETQVDEKTLFPANVADLLADLKKKYKVGAGDFRRGAYKGPKRLRRDFAFGSRRGFSRGGFSRGRSSKGKYSGASRDQEDEQPFLWKGQKGKGKRP